MDDHAKLYIEQMESWIEEQKVLETQLKRTIEHHQEVSDHHKKVASLNVTQLRLHQERLMLGIEEFDKWKKENNIQGGNE